MSKRAFSKEFKLGLIKEHDEKGVSFYKLDKGRLFSLPANV